MVGALQVSNNSWSSSHNFIISLWSRPSVEQRSIHICTCKIYILSFYISHKKYQNT